WRADPIGIFGDVLEARGIEVDAVRLEQGEPLPDWRDYDLLVAMGGAMSVWEEVEYPWLVDEKRAIREAVLAGIPYFGVCLGAQLLAAAFDTRVYLGPEPELGASPMFLTAAARRDPVFRGFRRTSRCSSSTSVILMSTKAGELHTCATRRLRWRYAAHSTGADFDTGSTF